MGIKDLPGSGAKFRATTGVSSFQRKLKIAAKHGELNILDQKNQEAIINEAKKDEIKIRRGQFTPLQQKRALARVMANDPTATKLDRIRIREVFKRLGPDRAESAKKPETEGKMVEINGRKVYLTEDQVERNLLRNKDRDESEIGHRSVYSKTYAGGEEVKSYGIHGSAEEIGVDRERAGKIGFAADYNKGKSPGNFVPKVSPAGIKPVGL